MNVFLVPVGRERHELYSEIGTEAAELVGVRPGSSWWSRQMARFSRTLADAEAERERRERGESTGGRGVTGYVIGKIAEFVVELRLLWHLRGVETATLVHPDDLRGSAALARARAQFSADLRRHWRWCLIDAGLAAILGPLLFFVPGPNLVAYYFVFRAIGHFLAARGAHRGRDRVLWTTEASSPLSAVRAALGLEPARRRACLEEIAATLGLRSLPFFVERVSRLQP